jgi:hypothetical protein
MATFHTSSGTGDEATVPQAAARATTTRLWWAGLLTLVAAVGLPRLNDYISSSENGGRLDREEAIFLLVVAAVTIALFGLLARWAVHAPAGSGRPARLALSAASSAWLGSWRSSSAPRSSLAVWGQPWATKPASAAPSLGMVAWRLPRWSSAGPLP